VSTTALRGGWVVDGSGRDRFRADVLISDDRIVEIGDSLRGDLELDASHAVIAPGFVDLHTHYDAQVLWERAVTSSSSHGVTTVIIGNCGFGIAPCRPENRDLIITMLEELEDMPRASLEAGIKWDFTTFAEYLELVDQRGLHANVAAYIGHSPIRFEVMGAQAYERGARDEEITQMVDLVRQAMDDGAVGFATSSSPTGRHHPTMLAELCEVTALARVLKEKKRGIGAFVPARSLGLDQLYELQSEVGRPFTYTALLSQSDKSHLSRVDQHMVQLAAGAGVFPQVSCRPLVFEATLRSAFALRAPSLLALEHVSETERLEHYGNSEFRRTLESEFHSMLIPPNWDAWVVQSSPNHRELEGIRVGTLAAERGCTGLDQAFDLAIEDQLATRFHITAANDNPVEVARLLNLDGVVLGLADSGAHPDQICDAVLPTDLLGHWVRELSVLSLEKAVRMLTGDITDLLGFPDRGYVREGAMADLVIFEPDLVGPGPARRVHDLPAGAERIVADQPTGIRHILVGGQATWRNGSPDIEPEEPGPGRVVRPVSN
jgi:N-acyl-D-amino-acid deacylase